MSEKGYAVYEHSRRGNLQGVREALSEGATPDDYMAYDGSTAVIMAARSGHGHIVQELLVARASPSIRTDEGSTVLHHAVSGGNAEVVDLALSAGVPIDGPNEDGVTPLILAAHQGSVEVIRRLVDARADISTCADGWGTALDNATGVAAELLESRGAKRSQAGKGQAMASASERFHYGAFESPADHSVPVHAAAASVNSVLTSGRGGTNSRRPTVGDKVKLIRPKSGVLTESDVGIVVEDAKDELPLKVRLGDRHDYYAYDDVVVAVELPPDSDRATPEGTARFVASKMTADVAADFSSTGLKISPVGFGCHRLENKSQSMAAFALALQTGCNLVDIAPNYTNGDAELCVGEALKSMIEAGRARRDELVIITKVGNVLGKQLEHVSGVPNMTKVDEHLFHCISPAWIEQEITRSLASLQLSCVDCLLLHCPEYETKADGIDMPEVYTRLGAAFLHLETEVARGRIASYGVSAAFTPLRKSDPEHLYLEAVMAQLPAGHHFRALQFPLNYAESTVFWQGHTPRDSTGAALDRAKGLEAPTLLAEAKRHGLATLVNRPLDGIYGEAHGVLRFSSLDNEARSFSELQLDSCDDLEGKISALCGLDRPPYGTGEGVSGELAAKTVKVLSALENVDSVLLGMRRPEYVAATMPLLVQTPPLPAAKAQDALRAAHNKIDMWMATAITEQDHGTAKDWRLPVQEQLTKVVGA